ncbi:hypothetical protein RSO01_61290 [Reyranella soli]|uniref:Uncharacterized protein n=1 Tax=Reyranella soli TaxID=1230389 RepID=A0A512NJ37_9HYPH|nr:hypothetical protein RSO01_61290 [Reyranella soli]
MGDCSAAIDDMGPSRRSPTPTPTCALRWFAIRNDPRKRIAWPQNHDILPKGASRMAPRTYAAAVMIFLSFTIYGQAADFGDVDCSIGSKMKQTTIMCLPRVPRSWIVCTGFPDSRGEGLWKDTGVPCDQPPPRSPAEYRPTTVVLHPPPLAPDAKRVIDQFLGIYFHCTSTSKVGWTGDACAEITQEFIRQAEAANVRYALVAAFENDVAKRTRGDAVGIPLGSELQWTVSFKAGDTGSFSLNQEITGVVEMVAGIWSVRPIIIGGGINMESRTTRKDAVGGAKDLLKEDFNYLLAVH